MDQFTSAQRQRAAELHDGRLRVGRIDINGVLNRLRSSIASSNDAASCQRWLTHAIPGLCKDSCKRYAFIRALLTRRGGAVSAGFVSKGAQQGAHLFGDLRRQGVDLTGPGMVAGRARAGHDGQTLDYEPTATVLALRAGDWERLTGVWQEAASRCLRAVGDICQVQLTRSVIVGCQTGTDHECRQNHTAMPSGLSCVRVSRRLGESRHRPNHRRDRANEWGNRYLRSNPAGGHCTWNAGELPWMTANTLNPCLKSGEMSRSKLGGSRREPML